MRQLTILTLSLAYMTATVHAAAPTAPPATTPASQPTDAAAVAKAKLNAAYAESAAIAKKLDAARAAAGAQYDASPAGKLDASEVAKKKAALDSARTRGDVANWKRLQPEYDNAKSAADAARETAIAATTEVIAAAKANIASGNETRRLKSEYYAAVRAQKEGVNITDPAARKKFELAEAIKSGTFLKGMTEAETDQAAKFYDRPAAPLKKYAKNESDGTRTVKYVISTSKEAYRWVKLTLKDGVVTQVDDLEKLEPPD